MKRKDIRKGEAEALRDEGAKAYQEGKSIQSCPQEYMRTMNRYQWERGYEQARLANAGLGDD